MEIKKTNSNKATCTRSKNKSLTNQIGREKETQSSNKSVITKMKSFPTEVGIESSLKTKLIPLSTKILNKDYDFYDKAQFSQKQIGPLKSYGYNTFKGIFREINEDRVTVIGQIKKPANCKMKTWPKISYFAIFDGHGGEGCVDFVNNNFHNYLVENKNFPFDIKIALGDTIIKIEEEFFKQECGKTLEESDKSGSCALVAIIFDNKIYISNIGDSRAIMSLNGGAKVKVLTTDHKPNDPKEFERAMKNGSKIYLDDNEDERDVTKLKFIKEKSEFEKYKNNKEIVYRVFPSDLSVMRTIGDIKAKTKKYGGNPGTIINKPDIFVYDININDDFIVMGCDGIFDNLSNQEICNAAWYVYKNIAKEKNYDIHELTQDACDIIIKYAMENEALDNLSCIIIGLEGVEKYLKNKSTQEKVNNSLNNFKKNYRKTSSMK